MIEGIGRAVPFDRFRTYQTLLCVQDHENIRLHALAYESFCCGQQCARHEDVSKRRWRKRRFHFDEKRPYPTNLCSLSCRVEFAGF